MKGGSGGQKGVRYVQTRGGGQSLVEQQANKTDCQDAEDFEEHC